MKRRGFLGVVIFLVAVFVMTGCHRDPNVRKQKYLESGKRYSAEGKYREATIQFANALKIDKNYPEAHYELAQAYVHLSLYSAAYSELLRTVALQPANYKARIDLGNLLLAGGKADDAQTQANAVLAAQPNNPDGHAMLSAIALKHGQKDQAMAELRRALELDPNRSAFHENLALLYLSDPAKLSEVEGELKKAVELDQKSINARMLLTAYYIKNNRWPDAEQTARSAISTDPKSLAARESLAEVFLKQGNKAKVEEVLLQTSQDLGDNDKAVLALANYLVATGQTDKAKSEYTRLALKYPKNLTVQKGFVRILLQVKDYTTAHTTLAELMKKNGKDPEVEALNGILLLNEGNAKDAVNALMEAANNAPKDAFNQLWLGKAALAKGDSELAEKSFRQATVINPASLEAEEQLARIASLRNDMNTLLDVANKTIAAAPRFPGGYVWRAMVEMNKNAADKAEADLKTAIRVAPQNPQAYLLLGKIRFSQKRFPDGIAQLELALQYAPDSVEALRLEVAYYISQKQLAKALARLNAQIAKSPKNGSYYDLLAELQLQNKDLDQAAASAQKAMQLNTSDAEAVMLYAQIQVQRGQVANAIATWEQWVKAHPTDAGATSILGILEESRGDQGKAEAYYKKSLQIQPQQPLAANNLAYLMLQRGENVDEALKLAQTARQALPKSPSTADTLAWAYYNKGTYIYSRDLLEDALKITPNNPTMQYHLGMVYSKLHDKNNATIHLKKAMALAPDSATAKDAKAALQGLGL